MAIVPAAPATKEKAAKPRSRRRDPVGPDAPGNVLVDGQARGVVMLWLATAGLDRDETLAMLQPGDLGDPSHRGHIWPGLCGADIQWAPQDLAAARLVATGDRAATAEVVAATGTGGPTPLPPPTSCWPRWATRPSARPTASSH